MAETFAGFQLVHVHGTPVMFRRDDRFKTFRVTLSFQRPLEGQAAARALLPGLLTEGTRVHPDRPSLVRAMDRLYGAHVAPGTGRLGETAVLRLSAEAVAGGFLPGRPDTWNGCLELLLELLLRPRLDDGGFPGPTFERERRRAADAARALCDDKTAWARQRALELGCAGEPYGVPEDGGLEAILALQRSDPESARRDFLESGRVWAAAVGAVPPDLEAAIAPLLAQLPPCSPGELPPPVVPPRRPPRAVVERAAMQQARQQLLLRSDVPRSPDELCALHVAVNLWGGGPHSRLFREVREKRSLAYQVGASGDSQKGIVVVGAGLDAEAAEAVRDEALAQLAAIASGEFADEELRTAVATITGPLLSLDDSLAATTQFAAEQWLRGFDDTLEQRIARYRSVRRDAVAAQAAAIWLDLHYLLRPEDAGR